MGRIDILSIPPPHTVASLKARLSRAEGALGRSFQLFGDVGGEIIMKDDDIITFLTDDYPGACEEEPMAVVYSKPKETKSHPVSQPKAPVSEPTAAVSPLAPPGFSKRIEATRAGEL